MVQQYGSVPPDVEVVGKHDDAAVTGDTAGTLSAKLRGINKLLAGFVGAGGAFINAVITQALPAGANIIGRVGIDQTTPGNTNGVVVNSGTITANQGTANATPWQIARQFAAGATTAYRAGVVAADVLAVPGTVTMTKQAGGAATAGTYTGFVVAGTRYGRTTAVQGNTTVITETTNLTIRMAFAQVPLAEFYDVYCTTNGAASKCVGRITEAQRAAGCVISAFNTVGAGGTPGAVDVTFDGSAGIGAAVNGGQVAQNVAYIPESLAPVNPGTAENVDIGVIFSRTVDAVAGSLVLYVGYAAEGGHYDIGDPIPVSFGGVANAYEANRQPLRLPTHGRQFVVGVASIAGTGASVTLTTTTN